MYEEFLKLCGYKDEEIKKESPRIDKAFKKLELEAEDIKRGEERIKKYFDIELEGIRKLLKIWVEELVDLILAKEEGKKIVYCNYPPVKHPYVAALYASENLSVTTPDLIINFFLGYIFDKLNPVLEAGEENGLFPGVAHCGLLQTRVGAIVKGVIPMPDLLLNSSHFCDAGPKTDELIHEIYNVPVAFIDSCWGQNWGDFPVVKERRLKYFAKRIDMALEKIKEITGYEVTEEHRRVASIEYARLWVKFLGIVDFIGESEPQPLSQNDMILPMWFVMGTPTKRIEELVKAMDTLGAELKERVEKGRGVVEKGAPRAILAAQSNVDPEVIRIMERAGIALPVTYMTWFTPAERSKTKHRSFAEGTSEIFLRHGMMHSNEGTTERWKEACKAWKPDGVILNYQFSCRPWAISPFMTKKVLQEELGIPTLVLDFHLWDKRDYGAEQLRTRIETFAEVIKAAKTTKEKA
jgi:hypothetical protein